VVDEGLGFVKMIGLWEGLIGGDLVVDEGLLRAGVVTYHQSRSLNFLLLTFVCRFEDRR
jgi:hypothetical protein